MFLSPQARPSRASPPTKPDLLAHPRFRSLGVWEAPLSVVRSELSPTPGSLFWKAAGESLLASSALTTGRGQSSIETGAPEMSESHWPVVGARWWLWNTGSCHLAQLGHPKAQGDHSPRFTDHLSRVEGTTVRKLVLLTPVTCFKHPAATRDTGSALKSLSLHSS